jgi:FkbM family methyltransferase
MNKSYQNWSDHINSQITFYRKGFQKNRLDNEFDWVWLDSRKGWKGKIGPIVKTLLDIMRQRVTPFTRQWLNQNSELLWNSRQIMEDELSKHLFDCYLLLAVSGYRRYYYPTIDFVDFISIQSEEDFISYLPKNYLGMPLKTYNIRLDDTRLKTEVSIVTYKMYIELLNRYRQYFIKRGDIDLSPSIGEVVLDCGACIGDVSIIFAALVGNSGEVHLFDPIPIHNRYCEFQANLNPALNHVLHINNLAVSNISGKSSGAIKDSTGISPGGLVVDSFETTSLDDYVLKKVSSELIILKWISKDLKSLHCKGLL